MDAGLIIIIIISSLFLIGSFCIFLSIFFEKEEINSIFNDNYPKNKFKKYDDELFIKEDDEYENDL